MKIHTFKIKLRLKVSKFHNEFMKSSSQPKYEGKIVRISAGQKFLQVVTDKKVLLKVS